MTNSAIAAAKHVRALWVNLSAELGWIITRFLIPLVIIGGFSVAPVVVPEATVYASAADDSLEVSEGGSIVLLELRNLGESEGEVPIRQVTLHNEHSLWYVVTVRGAPPGSSFASPIVLPPCRVDYAVKYNCENATAVLGRLPMRPGSEFTVTLDGVASDDTSRLILGGIWGLEVLWRVAFEEPLPTNFTDIGGALAADQIVKWCQRTDAALGALCDLQAAAIKIIAGDLSGIADLAEAIGNAIDTPELRLLLSRGVSGDALNKASALLESRPERGKGLPVTMGGGIG